jgi:D-alanyl-D-alanine carboxypeptidase (penicillin-binding protein 5/6)
MTDKLLIFGITLPRKPASICRLKRFSGDVLPLRLFMILAFTAMMLFPSFLPAQTRDDSLQVPIGSCIVKETGRPMILMAKDIQRPVSPASLTKIMTCIMAIESGRLEDNVLITKESTMVEPSKAGFNEGDKIRLIDLVKAAMINSSNDAAFAIAIHLSGNVDAFVAAMNYKARRIGMKNSRFTNPAGFDKGIYAGNTSTAEDLLRLTEYSVRNSVFNQVARLEQAVFMEQNTRKVYCLKTHNKLLNKYPYAVGIKTGFTARAGKCLIARAIKDNKDILLVMLNAKTDRWNVAVNIFDTAFSTNKLNPDSFAQIFRGDSGVARVAMIASQAKAVRIENGLSKSGHMLMKRGSAHHAIAELRASRTSKREAIAGIKSSRGAKHHALAGLKVRRASKSHIIADKKSITSSKNHLIAKVKNGHRLKNHEVVSSKPQRKTKRRVASSYTPLIMNIAAYHNVISA